MFHATRTAFVLATLGFIGPTSALDWPEFRGPTAQGVIGSAKVPLTWSGTNNVAWKQPIPGSGWSSPVSVGDRIYLTTAVDEGVGSDGRLSLHVLCLKDSTGEKIWDRKVFTPEPKQVAKVHAKNSQASATPLIADGRLYAHFGHLGTACLKLDGSVAWTNSTLRYPPVHGNGGSPVLAGNVLIFSCDGASAPFIVGLDAKTGRELWRTPRVTTAKKTFSFSTPIVIDAGQGTEVITPGSGVVYSLDPKTGRENWRVRYGEGYSVVPRPVYSPKLRLIYIATGFDRPTILAIRPGGKGDVTDTHVAWQVIKGAPNTPSPLIIDDELYFVSDGGVASCLDAKTGAVHWQERVGGNYSASPVSAGGRIYFQNEEGTCVVVKAGRTFEKLGENPLGERSLASFAAVSGAFYIRTAENLFKISEQAD